MYIHVCMQAYIHDGARHSYILHSPLLTKDAVLHKVFLDVAHGLLMRSGLVHRAQLNLGALIIRIRFGGFLVMIITV